MRRSRLIRAGAWVALALTVVALGARASSRRFLFPAKELPRLAAPADLVATTVTAKDGVPVRVLELRAEAGRRTVVHFHNNRQTVEACADLARDLHRSGLGVMLVEYRGYGASQGADPTEAGLYLDAEAGLDLLSSRGVGPEQVVLSGISLGTGVAAEMARRGRGARLVLMTPYTSIPDVVTDRVPVAPASVIVRDAFDTLSKTEQIRVPTLVVHGDADEIVPYWMGARVASAIPGAKLVRVPGGHHGDLFARDGDEILAAIAALSSG
jgi:fermentation-respiration switch protein FrsA (DUF1100 family)